mmetsp:Transcript_11637/g.28687  ORF Transcript_11637/g.28687 Transcript_11637/m.28687 type:complete len:124 (-) Transcript_11637:50-421(-)
MLKRSLQRTVTNKDLSEEENTIHYATMSSRNSSQAHASMHATRIILLFVLSNLKKYDPLDSDGGSGARPQDPMDNPKASFLGNLYNETSKDMMHCGDNHDEAHNLALGNQAIEVVVHLPTGSI